MTNPHDSTTLRESTTNASTGNRGIYLLLGGLVFALGIVSRIFPVGSIYWDKYLGDSLYAIMFYLCLAIIWPGDGILRRCTATAIFVIGIECFQLTEIPLRMRESGNSVSKLVSIVLGTKFGWGDMLAYFVGIAAFVRIDLRIQKSA